ncbi:MAG TPA: nuclear transport factor 2 family protein, partial [Ferruginibacter sp.]|nr:nuclear transport factor 2 family protein [Ferruginibacter sp.]
MKKLISITILFLLATPIIKAQRHAETAVANAVEQLRKAMVDADSLLLLKLTSSQLSYGHSSGHIDG